MRKRPDFRNILMLHIHTDESSADSESDGSDEEQSQSIHQMLQQIGSQFELKLPFSSCRCSGDGDGDECP